jgi:undecaprenyl diphosphate synthase
MLENKATLPRHIAFIMDGNRRWAKLRALQSIEGHKAGMQATKNIICRGKDLGINYMTFFVFSSENWLRTEEEVGFLMDLFFTSLSKSQYDFLIENNIKVQFLGKRDTLIDAIQKRMAECEAYTAGYDGITINLAFNYGAREEITHGIKLLINDLKSGHIDLDMVTEDRFAKYLYRPDVPYPDLVIRTSGEYRMSNFLLWQTAYSELYFTDILWPDFDYKALDLALESYANRTRRYGK